MRLNGKQTEIILTIKDAIIAKIPAPLLMRLVAAYEFFWGEPELRLLKLLVPRNRIAVDVGANYGVYTYFLSRLVRRVYAFEPNLQLADYLQRAVPGNVTVCRFGLSDRDGAACLRIPIIGGREIHGFGTVGSYAFPAATRTLAVALHRLDDQGLTELGFIKIDVEGHEDAVLNGGEQTIARWRPRMIIEIEQRFVTGAIRDRFARIAAMGYRLFYWRQNRLHEILTANSTVLSGESLSEVHNYICIPSEDQEMFNDFSAYFPA